MKPLRVVDGELHHESEQVMLDFLNDATKIGSVVVGQATIAMGIVLAGHMIAQAIRKAAEPIEVFEEEKR